MSLHAYIHPNKKTCNLPHRHTPLQADIHPDMLTYTLTGRHTQIATSRLPTLNYFLINMSV